MLVLTVPKDYRSKPGEYGETKKQKQFLMTPTASNMLDDLTREYETTRSDLLERVIRVLTGLDKKTRDSLILQDNEIDEDQLDDSSSVGEEPVA